MIDQLLDDLSSKFNAVSAEIFAKSSFSSLGEAKLVHWLIDSSGRHVTQIGQLGGFD